MSDDVTRRLAEALRQMGGLRSHVTEVAAALAAEVKDMIAEAEKRGYERGRRDFQFAPEGDNHHNATLCPYCSPDS